MTIVSPVFVYMFGCPDLLAKYPLAEIIGLRWPGLVQASGTPTSAPRITNNNHNVFSVATRLDCGTVPWSHCDAAL